MQPMTVHNDLLNQVHVAVIRLDGKVDNIGTKLKEMNDGHADHEVRLRTLESRPYVAPATVWKVVGTMLTACALAVAIISLFK